MKTYYIYLLAGFLALQSRIMAQNTEGYIPANLGRIVEVATPNGVLPRYHTLIGWDTSGFVKQASSQNIYKLFGNVPSTTALNSGGFNSNGYFGAPSGYDAVEIRFGDSSYYWIGTTLGGGSLSAQKAPFSFYNVGPRSANNPSTAGGYKMCFKVIDQDGNSLYTPGERINVYGDFAFPLDSTYNGIGSLATNPFPYNKAFIGNLRFGCQWALQNAP